MWACIQAGTPFLSDRDLTSGTVPGVDGPLCVPESDVQMTEKSVYYISRALQNIAKFAPVLIPGSAGGASNPDGVPVDNPGGISSAEDGLPPGFVV